MESTTTEMRYSNPLRRNNAVQRVGALRTVWQIPGALLALLAFLLATPAMAQAPVANDDNAGTGLTAIVEGGSISGTYSVLSNDTSATPMTAIQVSGNPANSASFQLFSDGTFNYTHDGTETSSDIFTYVANNGANSNVATVTISIINTNDTPVLTLNGNNPVNLVAGEAYNESGASATDEEDNNAALTASISIGGDVVDSNTPGTYVVTYNVTDSGGAAASQITRTVIVAANDPPVITLVGPATVNLNIGDNYVEQGANAIDPEEGPVPVNIGGDTVNTNVAGTYVVTYDASDSFGNNAVQVTRTVNVNSPPVITVLGDNPTQVNQGENYVDAGATATDQEDGDLTSSIVTDNPVDTNVPGSYTVTYTVTDSAGATDNQTRTVTVGANVAPTITGQAALVTDEETPIEITLADLTVNDPDSTYPDDFTLSAQNGANYSRAGNTITPADNFVGTLSVPVTVNDGFSDSPVFNVSITVNDVNDPPVADPQSVATDEDIPLSITLTGSDEETPNVTFALETQPGNGSLSGTVPNLLYTPALNFSGNDSFTFTVNDGQQNSQPATISISVNAVNDPPVVVLPIDDQVAVEASPFNLDVSGNFSDDDGDTLTYSADGLPPSGNIIFDTQTGIFSGTPVEADARDNDPYLVTVIASDGDPGGITAVDEFELNVSALNRANVSLDIAVAPDPAMAGEQINWTYTARNDVGPQFATDVVLTGSIFGIGVTVSSTAACAFNPPNGPITSFNCTIGNLPVGGIASVVITTTSAVGDVATFATAAVSGPVPIDPNLADNDEQASVGVAVALSNGAVDVLGDSSVRSVALGDVNGDGADDLVVGTAAGQPIQIWLSDGFRGFGTSPMVVSDLGANEGIALADFDGDGILDIVVANGGGTADVTYRGDGSGGFTTLTTLPDSSSQDVAVGDFDNDGNADAVFATDTGNPVYLGDGAGGMTLHATLGSANSLGVAVGQFNADARDDLAFANSGGPSQVWLKTDAGFDPGSTLAIGDSADVTVGNFGGGPRPDLVFGRVSTGLNDVPANPVLINDGTGAFVLPAAGLLGSAPTLETHTGDINDDGLDDLVFINASGLHQIWINNGSTAFTLHDEQVFADGSFSGVVGELGFADVDTPGGDDLAMGGDLQPGLGIYLNDGSGNLGRGDAVPPVLTLTGGATVLVPFGAVYVDEGATAEDNIDGTISDRIVVLNPVDTNALGSYTVTYNVTDFAGNPAAQITRTVNVSPAAGGGGGGGGVIGPIAALLLLWLLLWTSCRHDHALRRALQTGNKRFDP